MEKTALYNFHKNSGAKFVPFAGYEMPIQYKDLKISPPQLKQNPPVRISKGPGIL